MTNVFDGMAGIINGVLGGTVTVVPAVGNEFSIEAIFREEPIEVLDDDRRSVLLMSPTVSVQKPVAPSVAVGDLVRVSGGRLFKTVNSQPDGSPADDSFVIFELEEVLP